MFELKNSVFIWYKLDTNLQKSYQWPRRPLPVAYIPEKIFISNTPAVKNVFDRK